MPKVRCKLQGCKAQLTNPENKYCERHRYVIGENGELSERDVGRKSNE